MTIRRKTYQYFLTQNKHTIDLMLDLIKLIVLWMLQNFPINLIKLKDVLLRKKIKMYYSMKRRKLKASRLAVVPRG